MIIDELFENVAKGNEEMQKLLRDEQYLGETVSEMIGKLEEFEMESEDDQATICRARDLLSLLLSFMKMKECGDLADLILKYKFEGLSHEKHGEYQEGEILLFCRMYCIQPIYPKNGRGEPASMPRC